MLLEQLVAKADEKPKYDWEEYYRWYFSQATGKEVTECNFWLCSKCNTVNILTLPARYGKCRNCELIHLPTS